MTGDRRQQLLDFLREQPHNAFARYGLAMEMVNAGESAAALEQFQLLQQQHPEYVPGFQQAAQLLLNLGRREDARIVLDQGLRAAAAAGDRHAQSEMQGLLDDISAQR